VALVIVVAAARASVLKRGVADDDRLVAGGADRHHGEINLEVAFEGVQQLVPNECDGLSEIVTAGGNLAAYE